MRCAPVWSHAKSEPVSNSQNSTAERQQALDDQDESRSHWTLIGPTSRPATRVSGNSRYHSRKVASILRISGLVPSVPRSTSLSAWTHSKRPAARLAGRRSPTCWDALANHLGPIPLVQAWIESILAPDRQRQRERFAALSSAYECLEFLIPFEKRESIHRGAPE